jgi:hypothetical protein
VAPFLEIQMAMDVLDEDIAWRFPGKVMYVYLQGGVGETGKVLVVPVCFWILKRFIRLILNVESSYCLMRKGTMKLGNNEEIWGMLG